MAYGTVALHIHEHGERAQELLAAIADALGLETLVPNDGPDAVLIPVPDVEQARQTIEDALDRAGDEGRLVVVVRYPS
jgi:hypothetical protein